MPLVTEMLRFTGIAQGVTDVRLFPVDKWWERAVGRPPENIQRDQNGQFIVAQGESSGRFLFIGATPGRVDWFFAMPFGALPAGTWPSIGPWPESVDPVLPLVTDWLKSAPGFMRLAFGAMLTDPVPDQPSGYRRIEAALASDFKIQIPDESSDFNLQINLPIKGEPMTINRLTRWSVTNPGASPIGVPPGMPPPNPATLNQNARKLLALRLELDFNTPGDRTEIILAEEAVEVMTRLSELGVDTVRERLG